MVYILIRNGGENMSLYQTNIELNTRENKYFRKVLYTGKYMQLVIMSLRPNEEIGMEVHDNVDQFFRVEEGMAKFIVDGEEFEAAEENVVIVPAGSVHNVINALSDSELKLYTIYTPPNHPDNTVHETKAEAEKAEKLEHGK